MSVSAFSEEWVGVNDDREVFNIVLILDESGSMSSLGNEPENCVNGFVEQMKAAGLDKQKKVLFSLYRFGTNDPTQITVSYKKVELKDIPDKHGFKPCGFTPMYDAIGMALKDNEGVRNGVCHIITDGHENASQSYTHAQVFSMIEHMEKNLNWTFQYTGAGKDTYAVAQSLGVSAQHTVQYDTCCDGAASVAIGFNAGWSSQGANAIAIGMNVGSQGTHSITTIPV